LFGILSGWLVFLIAIFLIFIACSVVLKSFGIVVKVGEAIFVVESIVAAVLSAVPAIIIIRVSSTWLRSRSVFANYLCLSIAILLVLLSFPSIYTFSSVQSVNGR
jgi:hypothetical protein